ncbi:MAG: hypothetical protein R6U64_05330 [Bacteroidales bacterium]
MKSTFIFFSFWLLFNLPGQVALAQPEKKIPEIPASKTASAPAMEVDPYQPFIQETVPLKYIRVAIHVFAPSSGKDSFQDRPAHRAFLENTIKKLNELLSGMPPLEPAGSPEITSPHISDARIRVFLDTIYFHRDDFVHETFSKKGIVRHGAAFAHKNYVVKNNTLNSVQKQHTLHIIIAGTHPVTGGQVSGIGNKDFMLFKGWYHAFASGQPYANYGNLAHELGHSLGLRHHYGPDQCTQCQDLGCFPVGVTNNIMGLWPGKWESLSECQVAIIHRHLDGLKGNINQVLMKVSPQTEREQ